MKPRSQFEYYITPRFVCIIDVDAGAMSVTNDIENVVKYIYELHRKNEKALNDKRWVYRDSEGQWDEIIQEGGEFEDYKLLSKEDRIIVHTQIARLIDKNTVRLWVYAVYKNHPEYPEGYVIKRFDGSKGLGIPDENFDFRTPSLELVHQFMLEDMGLAMLLPNEDDDKTIIETWI